MTHDAMKVRDDCFEPASADWRAITDLMAASESWQVRAEAAEKKLKRLETKIKKLKDMRCDFDCSHCHEGDEDE